MTASVVSPAVPSRLPIASQPIWTTDGRLFGNEFLYRSRDGLPAQVDRWRSDRQDVATASVLEALFGDGPPVATTYAFVNITRSFLVDDRPLPAHAGRLVLEIVESVAEADVWIVNLAVTGGGFNGESGFRFELTDDLISRMEIQP